jgi:hypothetical protein
MLIAELLDAGGQMNILGHDRVFRRFDSAYRISIPADDMRLIASHVEPEQWADVMGAIVATNGLATFVNSQIEHGRQVLTASEACYARLDVRAIAVAALALADIAEAPGEVPPLKPIRCKPGPGPIATQLRTRLKAVGVAPLPPGGAAP